MNLQQQKERSTALVFELIDCARRRNAFSSVENEALARCINIINTPDEVFKTEEEPEPAAGTPDPETPPVEPGTSPSDGPPIIKDPIIKK